MAERTFVKSFENFRGLDLKSSPLSADLGYFTQLTNAQFGEAFSVRKRPGYQPLGQYGGFVGGHLYSYADQDTGAPVQELIAVNDHLWRLKKRFLRITRVGGSTNWAYWPQIAASSYKFELFQNGSTVYFLSDPSPLAGAPKSMLEVSAGIDALANFTCSIVDVNGTAVKFARVNGTQNNVSVITVNAGHTYTTGDVLSLFDQSTGKLTFRKLTGTTATTLTFSNTYPTVSVLDQQWLGSADAPIGSVSLRGTQVTATDPVTDVTFYSWEPVYFDQVFGEFGKGPFTELWSNRASENFTAPSFANFGNSCYIASGYTTRQGTGSPYGKVYKYDGQSVYRSGVPIGWYSLSAGGAGPLTGAYSYATTFIQYDKFGKEVESNPCPYKSGPTVTLAAQLGVVDFGSNTTRTTNDTQEFSGTSFIAGTVNGAQVGVTTITMTAGHGIKVGDYVLFADGVSGLNVVRKVTAATSVAITISGAAVNVTNLESVYWSNGGFQWRYAKVNGNQANVSTITVTAGHYLQVGDLVCIRDTTGNLTKKVVLNSVTNTTIGFDSTKYGAVSVTNGNAITCGFTARIYRSKAGGVDLFYCDEIPFEPATSFTYSDSTLDTSLTYQFLEPEIGDEHDLPPSAKFLCTHQGVLIYSGDIDNPNTVYKSLPDEPEYVSLATGSFDVPSTVNGPITAVASDTEDRLTVYKEIAIYDVPGDIPAGNFIVRPVREGDYGVSSHASIARINGVNIGVGRLGIIGVKNGELIPNLAELINTTIYNDTNMATARAIACNDFTNRRYNVYIPTRIGSSGSSDLAFGLDYSNNGVWFDANYSNILGGAPMGYSGVFNEAHVILSRIHSSGLGQFFTQTASAGGTFRYYDVLSGITFSMRTQFIALDEPSIDKAFLRLKIFSFYGPYETSDFTANTITVTTYKNFGLTQQSQSTLTFSTVAEFEKWFKLLSGKCRSLAIDISHGTAGSSPHLTGFELVVDSNYQKVDFKQ